MCVLYNPELCVHSAGLEQESSTTRQPRPSDKAPGLCQHWGCGALQQHWEEGSGSSSSSFVGQRRTFGGGGKIFGSHWLVAMGFAVFVTLCEGIRVGNMVIWQET